MRLFSNLDVERLTLIGIVFAVIYSALRIISEALNIRKELAEEKEHSKDKPHD